MKYTNYCSKSALIDHEELDRYNGAGAFQIPRTMSAMQRNCYYIGTFIRPKIEYGRLQ